MRLQDRLDSGVLLSDLLERFETAQPGHRDIQDRDVRLLLLDLLENLFPVRSLRTYVDIALRVDQVADSLANDAVVVGDENRNHPTTLHLVWLARQSDCGPWMVVAAAGVGPADSELGSIPAEFCPGSRDVANRPRS